VHCETFTNALQDDTANTFPNLGKHVAKTWLITCGILTRGARAFLHGYKLLANALRRPGECIAKRRQMRCMVSGQRHIQTLANTLQKRGRSCGMSHCFYSQYYTDLISLDSSSDHIMLDPNHDRNHVWLGSCNLIFPLQSHFQTLANTLQKGG
jgi:hypothetical protein